MKLLEIYPKGIILNKHNIDNQAVTYHFNFIFRGDQYIVVFDSVLPDFRSNFKWKQYIKQNLNI